MANTKTRQKTEKVYLSLIDIFLKDTIQIISKIMVAKEILMVYTKDNMSMEFERAMVLLNGITARSLKDNGKMELKMAMVFGNRLKETTIKETGSSIDSTVKVFTNIK